MVLNQFRHFQRLGHFPRDRGAINHPFGQALRHRRHRHANRRATQLFDQLRRQTRPTAQFQARHIGRRAHLFVGVNQAGAVHPGAKDMHILELRVLHIFFKHLPISRRHGACVGHHERQFKHLSARETTGGIAHNRPDNICHAVDRLVHQFRWFAAQLHGGITLHLDAAIAIGLNLVGPDVQHQFGHIGLWWQELVHPQRNVLRHGGCGGQRCGQCSACQR